jgi:protein-S-isoprenylcysteine O-methyltransferase Ste14
MIIYMKEYLILLFLWVIWCVLHSTMISTSVTTYLKARLKETFRFYRLFYNIVALITLVPVLLYSASIPGEPLIRWQGYFKILQLFLFVCALYFFIAGMMNYDMLQFMGIRQIRNGESHVSLSESGTLNTTGVMGITRHPWYLAAIMILWARPVNVQELITNIILTAYLITGAFLEERKLLMAFGDTYRDYQQSVSMLVPLKWIRSKIIR